MIPGSHGTGVQQAYFRGATAVVLVFDLTKPATLRNAQRTDTIINLIHHIFNQVFKMYAYKCVFGFSTSTNNFISMVKFKKCV